MAMSLLGSHPTGAALLDTVGWAAAGNNDERYAVNRISVAYPKRLADILKKPSKVKVESWAAMAPPMEDYVEDAHNENGVVVKLASLSNAVLNRRVMADLIALKRQQPGLFSRPATFEQVCNRLAVEKPG